MPIKATSLCVFAFFYRKFMYICEENKPELCRYMFNNRLFYMLCLLMLLAADVSAEWNNYVINYNR